jgi:tetratricopeptide (TPR) repeat protein
MADDNEGFDWISGGLKKLAEAAIVGLIGLGAAKLGLASAKDITDPRNWPLWAALVLLFAVYQFGWPPLWRAYLRWRVPCAKPGKISVLLARLHQDNSNGALRETVREAIVRELGDAVEVIMWPESLRVGDGRYADANTTARSKVQKWLNAKSCDLLIWGRVKGDKTIALRFTPCEGSESDTRSYGLTTDTLELPVNFVSDLAAAVATRVVVEASSAVHMSGRYLVPLMRSSAERLEPIVKRLSPRFDADTRGSVLHSYALVRETIGEQAGSNDDMQRAIAAFREALQEWTRERVPLDWAMIQNNLGSALTRLGDRESGTARLEEAVTAFREALQEWTRERRPLNWATIQNNLGAALMSLGERESGTARLEEAVAAFREALQERTSERVPLQWATTQNNLGAALMRLGERESNTARLEEAVATYREALQEGTRKYVPLGWAMTQNNLGNALMRLGERESGTARLEEAVTAYREALQEWTCERVPLDWAMTQNNLGAALTSLGERESESGTARLEEAVVAFHKALQERTRERVPLDWATTQTNLGTALMRLGEREGGTARLEEAVAAYRDALQEKTRERVPLDWAVTQNNLGAALMRLGERESGTRRLEEAVAAYREALAMFELAGADYYVATVRSNLVQADTLLSEGRTEAAT